MFFINVRVIYDQTVPKLHVSINILIKKHHILTWGGGGLKVYLADARRITKGKIWTIWTKILVHKYSAKLTFEPHFWSKLDVFHQFFGQF